MTMRGSFNRFPAIAAELVRGGQPLVKKAALDIESNASNFAPVDTGTLKASIQAQPTDNPLTYTVGTPVEYAPYQEYGTVHQSGQPYMRPAVERVRRPFIEAWRDFIRSLR